jgi:cytochrome b
MKTREETHIAHAPLGRLQFSLPFALLLLFGHAKYSPKAVEQGTDWNCVKGNSKHTKEQAYNASGPGEINDTPFASKEHRCQVQAGGRG